jgi:protein O-GlcNAc transferase
VDAGAPRRGGQRVHARARPARRLRRAQGRLEEAERRYRRSLELSPDYAEGWSNLAVTLRAAGRFDEAVACWDRALALAPGNAVLHSNLIFALDFHPRVTAEAAFAERRRWNDRHARPLRAAWAPHDNDPDPDRRLRVGYVSADFREHSAAVVFAAVVASHDHGRFDVVCYSSVTRPDAVTAGFRLAADAWRDVAGLTDEALAAQIRADGIDVLVDLSGHSSGHRLLAFARKPAPVQVTAWGHALGTGLDAMDYFFADPVTVPPAARRWFSEEVVDLPAFVCYDPPVDAPEAGPLPALAAGHVTFGCLNRRAKMSEDAVAVFARVLRAVPGSRLLVKDEAFNDRATARRLVEGFAAHGVEAARLEILGGSSRGDHLAVYGRVDLALDPFPHGGGVSALEALWMGVPMVTLAGDRIPGRMGASFLATLGLDDLVATTADEYVARARAWAADLPRLGRLRGALRQRMERSPLADAGLYTRAVEDAYRALWRRWCAGRAASQRPAAVSGGAR